MILFRICEELVKAEPKLLEMKNVFHCTPLIQALKTAHGFDAEFLDVVNKLIELGADLSAGRQYYNIMLLKKTLTNNKYVVLLKAKFLI